MGCGFGPLADITPGVFGVVTRARDQQHNLFGDTMEGQVANNGKLVIRGLFDLLRLKGERRVFLNEKNQRSSNAHHA